MAERNYAYLLRCADGTLYCGWTNDLKKRVAAHNAGHAVEVISLLKNEVGP